MRNLISIVESQHSVEVDEGIFDFIKKVAPILDPVARARKHGQTEVSNLTKAALSKFAQYMGRQKQDFHDVTWNLLFKYLTIADQLGLSPNDAKQIIMAADTRTGVGKILSASQLTPPAAKTWGKPTNAISGDPTNPQSAEVGQAIVTYILELAAIKYLEKAAGGEDLEQNQQGTATPAAPTATATTTAPTPTPVQNPTGSPTPVQTQLRNQLAAMIQQLGGTP
jgi:hypothetical protein